MSATFDRDAARNVLLAYISSAYQEGETEFPPGVLDALEACVRPTPSQGINRDALDFVLDDISDGAWTASQRRGIGNRILSLLRPIEGIVLTPEEARRLRDWYVRLPIGVTVEDVALAQRLEAAQ